MLAGTDLTKSQLERTMAQLEIESFGSEGDIVEQRFEVRSLSQRRKSRILIIFGIITICLIGAGLTITFAQMHCGKYSSCLQTTSPKIEVGTDFSDVLGIRRLASNITFKDVDGSIKDPIQIFSEHGYSWGRVRVMVDPDGGDGLFQDINYTVETAQLLKESFDMKILLDFHYSHWWSSIEHQMVPKSWKGESEEELEFEEIRDHVYQHTLEVIQQLKKADAIPDAVQIGNEVNLGMLWESGRLPENLINFVEYTRAATRAIRDGLSSDNDEDTVLMPLTVLHVSVGGGKDFVESWFQNFTNAGGEFDVIGLSYLPMHHGGLHVLKNVLERLRSSFPDKLIWIVETAYYWQESDDNHDKIDLPYPQTPDGQYHFLNELRILLQGYGDSTVFYWGSHYTQAHLWSNSTLLGQEVERRALFDENGVALKGIDGLFG